MLMLLLQAALFSSMVDDARIKLGLDKPIAIHTYTEEAKHPEVPGEVVAYVNYPRGIYVWDRTLAAASRDAQKVIAYHEACHIYLQTLARDARTPFQKHLVHSLVKQCTKETLGDDFRRILKRLENGYYSRLGTFLWWREQCAK
jgi:hypothetical protein